MQCIGHQKRLAVAITATVLGLTAPSIAQIVNPANGHTYYATTTGTGGIANAVAWAESLGGYLVTINDAAEQAWVYATFGDIPGVDHFIGLTDSEAYGGYEAGTDPYSPGWVWMNGEPVTYRNWALGQGEPSGGAGEDYVVMQPTTGKWLDAPSNSYRAIAEVPTGVLLVPDEYPTIQSAINASSVGDEVLVSPGTYIEKISFLGKDIVVRSTDGPDVTTIQCSGTGFVVECKNGEGPDAALDGFTITGGNGAVKGGGIAIKDADLTVNNCIIIDNSATERGGGISVTTAKPTITDCQFIGNYAPSGGGMSCYFASTPTISGCTFTDNTAIEGGGLKVSEASNLTLQQCTFIDNAATFRGGGMYSTGSDPMVLECRFESNEAAQVENNGGGGAMFSEYGDPDIFECLFLENNTPSWGAAYNFLYGSPFLLDCEFMGNIAYKGAGLSCSFSTPLVVNGLFAGNSAEYWSGAIDTYRSAGTFVNCTITANYAPDIGGVHLKEDPVEGGTIIANCILWGNTDDSGDEQHAQIGLTEMDPALLSVDYTCVQGWADLVEGEGNISSDPMFIGPNGGDYRLSGSSPCIDAADNTAVPEDVVADLDDNPRFIDDPDMEDTGFGNGPIVDMGVYEYLRPDCPADVFPDGVVDVIDLMVILSQWGTAGPEGDITGIDGESDGIVDVHDLLAILAVWGPCPDSPPPGMVLIPSGEFEMGRHVGGGGSDELPVHDVYIDSFYIFIYETTNEEYCAYLNSAWTQGLIEVNGGIVYKAGDSEPYCNTYSVDSNSRIHWDGSTFTVTSGKENHPMVEVSWYGAVAYSNWQSAQEGLQLSYDLETWECNWDAHGYRLPTEAEWEYAARGGNHDPYNKYPWGDGIDGSNANYLGSGDPYETGAHPWTTPVGYYDGGQTPPGTDIANGYGLYDMAGNVWDWCNDWYSSSYYSSSPPYDNPHGPSDGDYPVLRGGSWDHYVNVLRCANRDRVDADNRHGNVGFRLVLEQQ